MGLPDLKFVTTKEFLDSERLATEKHEYFRGEIFAMSGASIIHNRIFSNTFGDLAFKLRGKKCQPFGSDLRIHIPKNTLFTYPDMSIICGEIETTDDKFDTITNPSVIIEILSPSTRDYDMGQKFSLYREIESLKEYIMIDSEKICVTKYFKNLDNSWLMTEYKSIASTFIISTIDLEIKLSDVYFEVKFV
jgi:Uma2 family endonuclease